MLRYIPYLIVGTIVSFYLFPISFTFLPFSINTKMMLAAVGGILICYKSIMNEK